MGKSTSEVVFFSSYLHQTTSEKNDCLRHTRIRARHTHKFRVFSFTSFTSSAILLKSPHFGERFRSARRVMPKRRMSLEQCRGEKTSVKRRIWKNKAFTHNPLFDNEITPLGEGGEG